jgi:hypothetical protein
MEGFQMASISPREHESLWKDWRSRSHHVGRGFVTDGVIDPTRWQRSDRRVLFLLKEAYGDPSPSVPVDWDLCEYGRKVTEVGNLGGMFWTLAYWSYALNRGSPDGVPPFPDDQIALDQAKESLLSAAIVNVKKSGGVSASDLGDLRQYVKLDGDLLRQQIQMLQPQIVVCGNTWSLIQELWPDARKVYDHLWKVPGQFLIIDFVHPAHRGLGWLRYYALGFLAIQCLRELSTAARCVTVSS